MNRTIRESARNEFDKKMRAFSRRFKRFDWDVAWVFSRPRMATYHVDDHNCITPPPVGKPVHVEVIDVEIKFFREGMEQDVECALQIKDSKVIGHIDYLDEENGQITGLVKEYRGVEIDKAFRTRQYCDHCHTNRRRNRTYIVVEDERQIQVGSTCVEVYFGVPVPFIEIFADFSVVFGDEEGLFGGYGNGPAGIDYTSFAELCVGSILTNGYVGRVKAEEEGLQKTGNCVEYIISTISSPYAQASERQKCREVRDKWVEAAKPVMEIVNNQIDALQLEKADDDMDNFTYTCVQIMNAGFVPWRYVNYIAGWLFKFVREYQHRKEREATKQYPAEIGDRITFSGKVTLVKALESVSYGYRQMSTKYLIIFRTAEDEVLKTFYSGRDSFEVDEEVTITGTVTKQCDDNFGIATLVNRIKRVA